MVWVSGRSFTGIESSNPAWRGILSVVRLVFVVKHVSLRRADHSSRELLPKVVFLYMISKPNDK